MIVVMRTVVVLAYDRAPTFELAIPLEVFGCEQLADQYRIITVAAEPGVLLTEHGWTIAARRRCPRLQRGDLLVVPGWRDIDSPPAPQLLDLVRRAKNQGARVASLCIGAFALAASGILDGRQATTHWRYSEELARRHPQIRIDPAALYVADGDVFTSAGTAAGIDLCLAILREDCGARLANAVSRQLVVAAHRHGGQAQFVHRPVPVADDADPVAATMHRMVAEPAARVSVNQFAESCHLSTRQYLRRFAQATGTSPYQWLLHQRVARAQELLETSSLNVDQVARACGFGDAVALRAHFRRRLGISPTQYRMSYAGR